MRTLGVMTPIIREFYAALEKAPSAWIRVDTKAMRALLKRAAEDGVSIIWPTMKREVYDDPYDDELVVARTTCQVEAIAR